MISRIQNFALKRSSRLFQRNLCSVQLPRDVLENKKLGKQHIPDAYKELELPVFVVNDRSGLGAGIGRIDSFQKFSYISPKWKYLAKVIKPFGGRKILVSVEYEDKFVDFAANVKLDPNLDQFCFNIGNEALQKFKMILDYHNNTLEIDGKISTIILLNKEEKKSLDENLIKSHKLSFSNRVRLFCYSIKDRIFLTPIIFLKYILERSDVANYFTVEMKIGTETFPAVLNTVSDFSFISLDLAKKCKIDHLIDYSDNMDDEYVGRIHFVTLTFDKVRLRTSLYVIGESTFIMEPPAEGMSEISNTEFEMKKKELVFFLGSDVLKRYRGVIDFKNNKLAFKLKNATCNMVEHEMLSKS